MKFPVEIWERIISFLPPPDLAGWLARGGYHYALTNTSQQTQQIVFEHLASHNLLFDSVPTPFLLGNDLINCAFISILFGYQLQFEKIWPLIEDKDEIRERLLQYALLCGHTDIVAFILSASVPRHQYYRLQCKLIPYLPDLGLLKGDVCYTPHLAKEVGKIGCCKTFLHFAPLMTQEYEIQYVCNYANLYGHTDLVQYIREVYHLEPQNILISSMWSDDISPEFLNGHMRKQDTSVATLAYILNQDGIITPFTDTIMKRLWSIGSPEALDSIHKTFVYHFKNFEYENELYPYIDLLSRNLEYGDALIALKRGKIGLVTDLVKARRINGSALETRNLERILEDDPTLPKDFPNLADIALRCNLDRIMSKFELDVTDVALKKASVALIERAFAEGGITFDLLGVLFGKHSSAELLHFQDRLDNHHMTFLYCFNESLRPFIDRICVKDLWLWSHPIYINNLLLNVNLDWLQSQGFDFHARPQAILPDADINNAYRNMTRVGLYSAGHNNEQQQDVLGLCFNSTTDALRERDCDRDIVLHRRLVEHIYGKFL